MNLLRRPGVPGRACRHHGDEAGAGHRVAAVAAACRRGRTPVLAIAVGRAGRGAATATAGARAAAGAPAARRRLVAAAAATAPSAASSSAARGGRIRVVAAAGGREAGGRRRTRATADNCNDGRQPDAGMDRRCETHGVGSSAGDGPPVGGPIVRATCHVIHDISWANVAPRFRDFAAQVEQCAQRHARIGSDLRKIDHNRGIRPSA
jgi:hypothetical protein